MGGGPRRTIRSGGTRRKHGVCRPSQFYWSHVRTLQAPSSTAREHAIMQWARLQANVNCQLRRGGWDPVLHPAAVEAVLDVNFRPLPLPIPFLEITHTPPRPST